VTAQFATQAAVNANLTDALATAQAAQAEQAAAQAAAMRNVTETLAAVLGGLSALQASVGALAARMDAVEANTALLDGLVVSPPMPPPSPSPPPPPPPSPSPPPPPPPSPGPQFTCTQSDSVCAAFGSLYKSTGGSSWANQGGWSAAAAGTATSYCTFYGISCSGVGVVTTLYGRVRGAHRVRSSACLTPRRRAARSWISNNALSGTIPASLSSLTNLQNLCGRARHTHCECAPHAAPLAALCALAR
jgi:hypothetical protein